MIDTPLFPVNYSGDTAYAALGIPEGARPVKANARREYVAGGNGMLPTNYPRVLSNAVDDIAREIGWRSYDAMLTDPAVQSAVRVLVLAIVADGPQVTPCYKTTPGQEEGPKEKRAREMAEFGQRYLGRSNVDIFGASVDLLMACCYGSRLAEQVCVECEVGDDAGLLVLDKLKVKPRTAWRYVVDGTNEVLGIQAAQADPKQPLLQFMPRDKFAIVSWMPNEGDPRGTSILRAAYNAWNLKIMTWPQYFQHLTQFGGNSVVAELPPNAVPVTPLDGYGNPIPGPQQSPAEAMLEQLVAWQSGSALAIANGAKVYTVGGTGDGSAFTKSVDLFNREITQAILYQTRATLEAEHGSKADTDSSADIFGLLVRYGRSLLSGVYRRDVIHRGIEINFGKADADEFCPEVSFGETEHQDYASLWTAFASLVSSGALDPSQIPGMCQKIGIPVPDMDAMARLYKQQEQQMKAAEKALEAPAPGEEDKSTPPKAKEDGR